MSVATPMTTTPALTDVATGCDDSVWLPTARGLAETLGIECLGVVDPRKTTGVARLLFQDQNGLCIRATGKGAPGPVRAEFARGKAGYRLAHGGGNGQLIARAVGLKRARGPLTILDTTAGLGQDAFVLAGLGCHVRLLERSPVIHALLADGLARATLVPEVAGVVGRMELTLADSIRWLADQPPEPLADVIYLDPMFPHRDKSAEVKKEMQQFRPLVGDDPDAEALLAEALPRARYRVVVKRARRAPPVAGPAPSLVLEGKSSRYDVYPLRAMPELTGAE